MSKIALSLGVFIFISNSYLFCQKLVEMNIGDTPYFEVDYRKSFQQAKGITLSGPRFKDSLPDGVYKAYRCYSGCKPKTLFLEAIYHNGVKHEQEIFYGYNYDKANRPYLASILLTEYKNGKVDGMYINAHVNSENTVTIEGMIQYKNGEQNGISIYAPNGLIRQVLYFEKNEVKDTIWVVNDSTNNIWLNIMKSQFYSGDYLSPLLKKSNYKCIFRRKDDLETDPKY